MQILLLAKDSVGKTIFILLFNFTDYLAHTPIQLLLITDWIDQWIFRGNGCGVYSFCQMRLNIRLEFQISMD